MLGVGGLEPQVLHEGANLGLTHGLLLLVLEAHDQLEPIVDAHVGVGLRARCWSFVQSASVEATLNHSLWSEVAAGNADLRSG